MTDTLLSPTGLHVAHDDAVALDRLVAESAGASAPADVTIEAGGARVTLRLDSKLLAALLYVVGDLREGRTVHAVAVADELTTQQAADVLGVSRPFLVKQIDAGLLPARRVGSHRRVRLQDVLAFKEGMTERSRAALRELTDLDQDLGLYA